jgi:mono/diheme cytochrome c family protein
MKLHFALLPAALVAASAPAAVDFVKDVQPILEQNCVRCHNPKGTDFEEGNTDVNLSTKGAAFEVASTIVSGKPDKSKLYTTTVLADDAKKLMPPKNKVTGIIERLTKPETEILKDWITEGAKWPDGVTLTARKKDVGGTDANTEKTVVAGIHQRILAVSTEKTAADMKPYQDYHHRHRDNFRYGGDPGGKFKMGSPEGAAGRKPDEGPVHEVEISPFWMGKCEVTWNEFELFMYRHEEAKIREARKLDQRSIN